MHLQLQLTDLTHVLCQVFQRVHSFRNEVQPFILCITFVWQGNVVNSGFAVGPTCQPQGNSSFAVAFIYGFIEMDLISTRRESCLFDPAHLVLPSESLRFLAGLEVALVQSFSCNWLKVETR